MISLALFPCVFTDGARVLGEVSALLRLPVYTDDMILREIAENRGRSLKKMKNRLFFGRNIKERRRVLSLVKGAVADLLLLPEDYIYYGFFMSLLGSDMNGVLKVLIQADEQCRVLRAMRQEGLRAENARRIIAEHDLRATNWSRFVCGREPYDQELYDSVITYDCQDLIDVTGYIYMLHEEYDFPGRVDEVQRCAQDMKCAAGVEQMLSCHSIPTAVDTYSSRLEVIADSSRDYSDHAPHTGWIRPAEVRAWSRRVP
jgi:cytidylate kinase